MRSPWSDASIVVVGLAVEADPEEAEIGELVERPGEVLDLDERQPVERARRGLGEDAGLGRRVAGGGEQRVGAEGERRSAGSRRHCAGR